MAKNVSPPPLFAIPPVFGHRGAAAYAPENTLAAIRLAAKLKIPAIEIDVKLTEDSVPVLFHDETLDRTTDGKGAVAATTFAKLRQLDAGGWKARRFAGERVPTLEEAVRLIEKLRLAANFEIKPCPGREIETARITLAELRRLWPQEAHPARALLPFISSFSLAALEIARDMAPDWPRGLLFDRLPKDWRLIADVLQPTTINVNAARLTPRKIADIVSYGLPVLAYTVNDPARALSLWQAGLSGIFSDKPDRMLRAHAQQAKKARAKT